MLLEESNPQVGAVRGMESSSGQQQRLCSITQSFTVAARPPAFYSLCNAHRVKREELNKHTRCFFNAASTFLHTSRPHGLFGPQPFKSAPHGRSTQRTVSRTISRTFSPALLVAVSRSITGVYLLSCLLCEK